MLLDTNILIRYLDGEERVIHAINSRKNAGYPISISVITVTELLSFPLLDEIGVNDLKEFVTTFTVIPVDTAHAEVAAEFRRRYRFTTTDSIIIAAAYIHGIPFATRDKKLHAAKEIAFVQI